MLDITLCASTICPRFGICFRGQALPSAWSKYQGFPFNEYGCDHFWPIEGAAKTVEFMADEDDDEDDCG